MNLQQLRYVQEAARRQLNLTETARALHTSQPGISKGIIELEEELGVDIFVRHGKRLKRITEAGHEVLKSVDIVLREIANLKRIGAQFAAADTGRLRIATTHTQARYYLPPRVAAWRQRFPKVQVALHQAMPAQVAQMLLDDAADIGLATETLADVEGLVTLPCYEWQHVMVVPREHPLATVDKPTLAQLAAEPLVLYHPTVTGRTRIDRGFARAQLVPQVAIEAIDSDVILTYVRLGLGVGIVAEQAVAEGAGNELIARPLAHLFGHNISRVAFKKGSWLRDYVFAFAQQLSDRLTPEAIRSAMAGQGQDYSI
jgi:LysR family transcriptional regulator, cys regulon transcriptional activator